MDQFLIFKYQYHFLIHPIIFDLIFVILIIFINFNFFMNRAQTNFLFQKIYYFLYFHYQFHFLIDLLIFDLMFIILRIYINFRYFMNLDHHHLNF